MRRPSPAHVILTVLGLGVLAGVAWKVVLALRSDETRVRLVLEDVVRHTRNRDPGAVIEYVDPQYRDPVGHTYGDLKLGVVAVLGRAESAEAEITPLSIRVEGDRAFVRARARAKARLHGEVITLKDGGFGGETFDIQLRRYESYFRLTSVRAVGPEDGSPPGGGNSAIEGGPAR